MKSKVVITFSTIIIFFLAFLLSCNNNTPSANSETDSIVGDTIIPEKNVAQNRTKIDSSSYYKNMLDSIGFVPLYQIDSSIAVELRYSSTNNFLEKDLYGDFNTCYLEYNTAKKLSKAQKLLKEIDPGLSLVVFDAVRPRCVQEEMWNKVEMEIDEKKKFLANPDLISLHNFGAAVDVGIILKDGSYLDMGTDFDYQGELAYPSLEEYFVEKGILGINQVENRKILRNCMTKANFIYNKYEWWHFSSYRRAYAIEQLPIVESFNSYSLPTKSEVSYTENKVTFKVQILTSKNKLKENSTRLKGFEADMYSHQGSFKYTSGAFYDLKETYKYRDSLRTCCFKQAFVVCFYNGERIDIQRAIKLVQ